MYRQAEPNVLPIEAIIKKNENYQKKYEGVATDLKTYYINQLKSNTNHDRFKQHESIQNFLKSRKNQSQQKNKIHKVPPLPPRQKLNSLKGQTKVQSFKSTRISKHKIHKPLEVIASRHSLSEAVTSHHHAILSEENQKVEIFQNRQKMPKTSQSERKLGSKKNSFTNCKLNQFQYNLQIPEHVDKSKKINSKKTISYIDRQNQQITIEENSNKNTVHKKTQNEVSFCKNKFKASLQIIPDYVIAAIDVDCKPKSKELMKKNQQFNFEELNNNKIEEKQGWDVKPSNYVKQMKRVFQFSKTKRTDQSIDGVMEPFIENVKLVKKTSQEKKQENMKKKQKSKSISHKIVPKKKKKVEKDEVVCGWEIEEGQMFQDYY